MSHSHSGWRLSVDIGGTFTDLALAAPDGALHTHKLLSTPDDYGVGIRDGVAALLGETGLEPDAVDRVSSRRRHRPGRSRARSPMCWFSK